jgi:uncharacterized protein (TIGR00297 family)
MIAAGVTILFAVAARVLRGVSNSGAAAGGLACLLLFLGGGPGAFAALAVLFAMTWLSTRLGYAQKRDLGVAERREGRNGWQVSANLGVAALTSLLYATSGNRTWLVATAAALAEAATDTVASEVGQTHGQNAMLITTGQSVPSGTDGGITQIGTLSGIAAGLVVVAVAVLGGMVPRAQFWIPASAGVIGMFVDSVQGATLQRRGWMNNEAVNLWATLIAAALAYLLSR